MSSVTDDSEKIVLDVGACTTKLGYAGQEEPRAVVPTLTGTPLSPELEHYGCKGYFVGQEARDHRGVLQLTRPIRQGVITDYKAFEEIIRCALTNNLLADPQYCSVLMTDKLLSPRKQRERMCQMMFETFGVAGYHVVNQCLLAIYSGIFKTCTGLVVDVGDDITELVPVFEGFVLKHLARRTTISGRTVTKRLGELVSEAMISSGDGSSLTRFLTTTPNDLELIQDMKPEVCHVALDYAEQCQSKTADAFISQYVLPDGTTVVLDEECYAAPEVLFNPLLVGCPTPGLSDLVYEVVMECPIEIRREMFSNIILIGGTCDMKGFPERLKHDLELRVPETVTVKLLLPDDPDTCTWIGGSEFALLPSFSDTLMSRHQYEESGVGHLHNKFYYGDDFVPGEKTKEVS